jgi:hypothetical protein
MSNMLNAPLVGGDSTALYSMQGIGRFQSLVDLPGNKSEYGQSDGHHQGTYHHVTKVKCFVLEHIIRIDENRNEGIRNWERGLHYFADDASKEEAYNSGKYQP